MVKFQLLRKEAFVIAVWIVPYSCSDLWHDQFHPCIDIAIDYKVVHLNVLFGAF